MTDKYIRLEDTITLFCDLSCGNVSCPNGHACEDVERFNTLTSVEIDENYYCEFCTNHEDGDTLYEMSDWDGGIGFDYIRDIHYCPICGRRLK